MASFIWTLIFALLAIEIVILLILLIPLPGKVLQFLPKMTRKLFSNKTVVVVLIILLGLMFADSINTRMHCVETIEDTQDPIRLHNLKTSKLRAERNIYLSFDALFLMFLIWRISELLEEVAQKKLEKKETVSESSEQAVEETKAVEKEEPKEDGKPKSD